MHFIIVLSQIFNCPVKPNKRLLTKICVSMYVYMCCMYVCICNHTIKIKVLEFSAHVMGLVHHV